MHYVAVASVNLYASGRVSLDYPITRGHADDGVVKDQSAFSGGRGPERWMFPNQCVKPAPLLRQPIYSTSLRIFKYTSAGKP